MTKIDLKILNESGPNILQYLPYGVTSIETMVEGDKDEAEGFVYPIYKTDGRNKFYLGYADKSEDFLVIWGAGRRDGLRIDSNNVNGRLFLQVLHRGKSVTRQTLSLRHSDRNIPISRIELAPAIEDEDTIRMNMSQEGEICTILFKGNLMPHYYSRWFPPRPSQGMVISYHDIEAPPIALKFMVKKDDVTSNVNSDIEIFLNKNKIAEISGDWHYSWPHAELFTVFGDSDNLVLRVWLYWIHENYSKNILLGGNALLDELDEHKDEKTKRRIFEAMDIECPDIERFDFLIDMRKERVSYVGTDFHYQEYWYMLKDDKIVEAKIANDVGTIFQVLKKLKNRFNPPQNYNPMEYLRNILMKREVGRIESEVVPDIKEYTISNFDEKGNVTYRAEGMLRKHVPHVKNGKAVAELVSSVVTG